MTRSLINAKLSDAASPLGQIQSTLQRAQSVVSRDEYLALKPLLALPNREEGGTITETDYVNVSVKENLLHFAVRQLAGCCVHMLVNAPYNWDPQRRNILGASPLDIAIRNYDSYLPVVWPLAMISSDIYGPSLTNPSLTSLLLRPPNIRLSPPAIDELCNKNSSDLDFTISTVNLLFELIRCTPNMLMDVSTTLGAQRCPHCLEIGDATQATCLTHQSKFVDFPTWYGCWLWHRHHTDCGNKNRFSPFSLLDCCRVVIRREIMRTLLAEPSMNYARAIKSLNLPSRMLAFLSFREMWPVVNAKDRFEFRRSEHKAVPMRRLFQPFHCASDASE